MAKGKGYERNAIKIFALLDRNVYSKTRPDAMLINDLFDIVRYQQKQIKKLKSEIENLKYTLVLEE